MANTTISVEDVAKQLQRSRIVDYVDLAGFIIVYFDWLLVFDSEIKFIWKAKGIRMKVLYLLTRYLPLAYIPIFLYYLFNNSLPASVCTTLYEVVGLMFTIGAICAALVVTIRTWAVWAKEKYVTYILFGTYAVASALILILYIISLKFTTAKVIIGSPLPLGCLSRYKSLYLPAAFVVEAAYDTVILLFMLIRGASLVHWGKDSTLFRTIYGDGILFYVYITAVSIANFSLLFGNGSHASVLLMFQGSLRSVLACRIVLRIRMQHDKQQEKWQLNTLNTENSYPAVHIERSVIESSDTQSVCTRTPPRSV